MIAAEDTMQPGQTLDSIQGHAYGCSQIVVNIGMDCYAWPASVQTKAQNHALQPVLRPLHMSVALSTCLLMSQVDLQPQGTGPFVQHPIA